MDNVVKDKQRKVVPFHNNCYRTVCMYLSLLLLLSVSVFVPPVSAAPHNGDSFDFAQPDGSLVPVRVFGDEFYQDVESPDGYTLVRDADGWICYAELSADGSEYVSTGVRYMGGSRAVGVRKGLRIGKSSVEGKHRRNREILGYEELIASGPYTRRAQSLSKTTEGQAASAEVRRVVGLTLLIEFPDQRSTIAQTTMSDFCNRAGGVNGTTVSGSVHDYYYDVSNGLLDYTNLVTPFVMVDSNKTYYDRGTNYQYVPQLLTDALRKLAATGFDISTVTTETSGSSRRVVALNVFYAGSPTQGWANGIWPHAGTYRAPSGQTAVTIDGVGFSRYQLSSLGTTNTPPGIGTFVHENGHMLMGWPDFYSYEQPAHSNGVGNWCVMNSSNGTNPQQPNAYLRAVAGWTDITPVTDATTGVFGMPSNGHQVFKYTRNTQESFYIEARRRTAAAVNSRNAAIPGSGLLVWHVHTAGSNTSPSKGFPLLALVQADGRNDLENKTNSGDATDPFRARHNASFNKTTNPAAAYFDGVLSNIDISEISDSGAAMTFRVGGGAGGAPTYWLSVVNGQGSGYYSAGQTAEITAPDTNAAGRAFMRWTSASIEPTGVYASPTTVRMPAEEATVTANYARKFVLPGLVEADTFGYAQGVTSLSSTATGVTGGRVARIVDTSKFAEYAVEVETAGQYKLSYKLLPPSRNTVAGKFYLRNAVSGVLLDSVTVPAATSSTVSLQTITGALGASVNLSKGRTVWRFEAAGGTYSIDQISVESLSPTPVVVGASAGVVSYDIRASYSGNITFTLPDAGRSA